MLEISSHSSHVEKEIGGLSIAVKVQQAEGVENASTLTRRRSMLFDDSVGLACDALVTWDQVLSALKRIITSIKPWPAMVTR